MGHKLRKTRQELDFCITLYDLLVKDSRASQTLTIERAKALLDEHKPYAEQNPCTTVFQLIGVLSR